MEIPHDVEYDTWRHDQINAFITIQQSLQKAPGRHPISLAATALFHILHNGIIIGCETYFHRVFTNVRSVFSYGKDIPSWNAVHQAIQMYLSYLSRSNNTWNLKNNRVIFVFAHLAQDPISLRPWQNAHQCQVSKLDREFRFVEVKLFRPETAARSRHSWSWQFIVLKRNRSLSRIQIHPDL